MDPLSPAPTPPAVSWDIAALSQPPATYPAPGFEEPGVEALFYDGVPWRGRPTRVFAWLGLPDVPTGQPVPGMVLVHGGGGTAFAEWVRLWTERGYAAIAMDTCGCTAGGDQGQRPRHELGGPAGWGGFDQVDQPVTDQWTYHAVAAAILGHSLLRSLPEVDPDRIGLTGVSWGGFLSCIIAGVDSRLKFVVPVYGCGFYDECAFGDGLRSHQPDQGERWLSLWDPSHYLPRAAMPMLWVTGTNDFAYWLPALQKSYRLPSGPRTLAIRLRMPHGHDGPSEKPEEIRLFAESLLRDGQPLARITGQGYDETVAWASFESPVPIVKAELLYTRDTGPWPDRLWEAVPATLNGNRASAPLPEGTAVHYLNLIDERGVVVSSEHAVVRE